MLCRLIAKLLVLVMAMATMPNSGAPLAQEATDSAGGCDSARWIRKTLSPIGMTTFSQAKLDSMLDQHRVWFHSDDGSEGRRIELSASELSPASLCRANLSGAELREADLSGAYLFCADLSGAKLAYANLSGADLRKANLSGTTLFGAFLNGILFEPDSLPSVPSLATASGLRTLRWWSSPAAIVQLRERFGELGFKQQEREVICALRRDDANLLEYVFFDLTSEYGSNLSRPWNIFLSVLAVCTLVYLIAILWKRNSGLWLLMKMTKEEEDRLFTTIGKHVERRDDITVRTQIHRCSGYLKEHFNTTFRWVPMPVRLLWWAGFFSLIRAFNIGFRDVNFGRWLKLLTRKKFDLEASGWIRVVAGFQSLASVYLVALWILSWSGTPFK